MKYDFISSQILNDQDWQNALMQGFAEKIPNPQTKQGLHVCAL